ncbi:MAG: hypothetical protein E6R13_04690 [Spirochaetes bacterium]|nr:MAG: hypothetical protein E6R13_04690 [Spirochaetota bacterium]
MPYYTPNMATGRAFDVPVGTTKLPPSLRNILEKISDKYTNNKKSILEHLPEQGVVLLNTALTVEKNMPNSHKSLWAPFTVELIKIINERNNGLIFLLWGNNALKYIPYIDYNKHVVIGSSHPSPLSNSKNCGTFPPFSEINCFELANITLKVLKEKPILW